MNKCFVSCVFFSIYFFQWTFFYMTLTSPALYLFFVAFFPIFFFRYVRIFLTLRVRIRQRQFSIEQYRIVKFININRYIQNGTNSNRSREPYWLAQDLFTFVLVSERLIPSFSLAVYWIGMCVCVYVPDFFQFFIFH